MTLPPDLSRHQYFLEKILIVARLRENDYLPLAEAACKLFALEESPDECSRIAGGLSQLLQDTIHPVTTIEPIKPSRTAILDISVGPDGSPYLLFPDDLLDDLGWDEGDQVLWIDNGDGSFTLKKRSA